MWLRRIFIVGEDTVLVALTLSPDPGTAPGVFGGEVGDTRGATDVNDGTTLGIVGDVAFLSIFNKESLEKLLSSCLHCIFKSQLE